MTDSRPSQTSPAIGGSSQRLPNAEADAANIEASPDDLTVISTRPPLVEGEDGASLRPLEVSQMLQGERLGQFVLQNFVGGGGMGVVFRASDTTLNRDVAVKVLARSQSQDEETLRRFKNEAQSAARLDHENIARVYYVGEDRGVHYIVFEFIEGTNIRDLVQQQGPLPLAEAISYTLQIAEALAHASQRDVIHRDIKPSNVLITPDGKAKLVDMGLARLHQVDQGDQDLTASGVTLGTFDYISPEQARDPRSADVRSDLYSLGCSLYFMLTGRPPFPEGTVLQKLLQHQAEDPPDPRNFRPELPVELASILAKLLAKNPARRYQLPSDLIVDLTALGERIGLSTSGFTVNYRPQLRPGVMGWQRHLPWALPLAILVVAVLLLNYVWSRSDRLDEPPDRLKPLVRAPRVPASPPGHTRTESTKSVSPKSTSYSTSKDKEPDVSRDHADSKQDSLTDPQKEVPPLFGPLPVEGPGSRPFREWLTILSQQTPALIDPAQRVPSPVMPEGGSEKSPAASTSANGGRASSRSPLLVTAQRQGEGVFASLAAAIAAAKDGDTIELDFDGRREVRPVALVNTNLTIRAAEGRRPVIVFRPGDADAISYPRAMIFLAGGSLTIEGLEVELHMPRKISAEAWSLFELRRANQLRCRRSTFSVRNTFVRYAHPRGDRGTFQPLVAFFDLKAPLGQSALELEPLQPAVRATSIELSDCVMRGEAAMVRGDELESGNLEWENGLLATSDSLLTARGAALTNRSSATIDVTLKNVTAIMGGGLAHLVAEKDMGQLPVVRFQLTASVLAMLPSTPLVDQQAPVSFKRQREQFSWTAFDVDFEGTEIFWRLVNSETADSSELDFAEWEDYWGSANVRGTRRGVMPGLARVPQNQSLSDLSPADLAATTVSEEGESPQKLIGLGCDPAQLPIPTPPDGANPMPPEPGLR